MDFIVCIVLNDMLFVWIYLLKSLIIALSLSALNPIPHFPITLMLSMTFKSMVLRSIIIPILCRLLVHCFLMIINLLNLLNPVTNASTWYFGVEAKQNVHNISPYNKKVIVFWCRHCLSLLLELYHQLYFNMDRIKKNYTKSTAIGL